MTKGDYRRPVNREGVGVGPFCKPPSPRAHPLIHVLYEQLRVEKMSRAELARRSGVGLSSLEAWWKDRVAPNVMNLEACLNVFGLGLKVYAK